jgi:hypothetical protein
MKCWLLLALGGLIMANAADLPVKNIILYKHGVGYFERAGTLGAGESARLDFKAGEMNDVLKSLTVEVKGGAGVTGLRYDSAEPLERKLEQFPVRLGSQEPLSKLLDSLKGARLKLTMAAGQEVEGVIVAARHVPATDRAPEQETVTLLLDNGELRTWALSALAGLRFTDARLQLQLKDYLSTLSLARSTDRRSVYIDSVDTGQRQITASYMIPVPVWKSSYRLIFPAAGDALLEGWAIVDNTTGEDWNGVRLALVSGRPISFISRLYEPRYLVRREVGLPEEQPAAPQLHEGVQLSMAMPLKAGRAGSGEREVAPAAPVASVMADDMRLRTESTVAATAEGRELGELFEYRFGGAVTIRKNESAMLPFLQQKLAVRKLLIYNDESSPHPLNAAELTNSTGKTLDGGPVTVYDGGAYAGEALFETLKAGDKRLVSYGIDIGTRVTTRFDSAAGVVQEASFRRGVLTTRSAVRETKTYTIRNVDSKDKTLILEHPARPGYKLLNLKPLETTATAWRFEVKLAAAASQTFTVDEERFLAQSYAATNLTPDFLATLVSTTGIAAPVRKGLEQMLAKKRDLAQVDKDLELTSQQLKEGAQDQQRMRENMNALDRVAGQQEQVQRYAGQLAAKEAELARLRDRQAELRRRKTALESELNAMEF